MADDASAKRKHGDATDAAEESPTKRVCAQDSPVVIRGDIELLIFNYRSPGGAAIWIRSLCFKYEASQTSSKLVIKEKELGNVVVKIDLRCDLYRIEISQEYGLLIGHYPAGTIGMSDSFILRVHYPYSKQWCELIDYIKPNHPHATDIDSDAKHVGSVLKMLYNIIGAGPGDSPRQIAQNKSHKMHSCVYEIVQQLTQDLVNRAATIAKRFQGTCQDLQAELDAHRGEVARLQEEAGKAQAALVSWQAEFGALQRDHAAVAVQLKRREDALQMTRREVDELKKQYGGAKEQLVEYGDTIRVMKEELSVAKQRTHEVEVERDEANRLLAERSGALVSLEQTSETALREAHSRHADTLAARDTALAALRAELEAARAQHRAQEDEKDALRAAIGVAANGADHRREHARLRDELAVLQDTATRQAGELAASRAEAAAIRATEVATREREQTAAAQIAGLRAQNEASQRSIEELIATNAELYAKTLTLRHLRTAAAAEGNVNRGVAG